jgi:hypothetical protein
VPANKGVLPAAQVLAALHALRVSGCRVEPAAAVRRGALLVLLEHVWGVRVGSMLMETVAASVCSSARRVPLAILVTRAEKGSFSIMQCVQAVRQDVKAAGMENAKAAR